jgi:hypothetical protein
MRRAAKLVTRIADGSDEDAANQLAEMGLAHIEANRSIDSTNYNIYRNLVVISHGILYNAHRV